jgi:hypothetical protein
MANFLIKTSYQNSFKIAKLTISRMLKKSIAMSLPRRRESRRPCKNWIPAGVYPDKKSGQE